MKSHFAIVILLAAALGAAQTTAPTATPAKSTKANYELAARWTATKVGKLVFDTAVTPHWLDSGGRFWYSYENTSGRKFYLVDPVRKSKALVFDPTKLAALLDRKSTRLNSSHT